MSGEDNYDFLNSEPEKTLTTRLIEKCQNQPFLVGGWLGTIGAVAYGAYRYKTRGPSINTSIFSVQLRVLAQGAIVSSLIVGMLHQMYLEHYKNKETKQISKDEI